MRSVLTKKEIVRLVTEEVALTQVEVKDVVQRVLDKIASAIVRGRLELRNFGVFEVRRRRARKARNPRTGAEVHVPSWNSVTFKPGKAMWDRLNPTMKKAPAKPKEQPAPLAGGDDEVAKGAS